MSLHTRLELCDDNDGLIEKLKSEKDIPVVMWGNGSMSYSTRKFLDFCGIKISAIWVDGTVKEQYTDSIPVMNYKQITERFNKINVVCGHSRYDMVDQVKKRCSEINDIYCFVNICYGQWKGISKEFIENHIVSYELSYDLMGDDLSKECFAAYLNCKNTGNYRYLMTCCEETATYFDNPFYSISDHEIYLDVGAYVGDTIKEFARASNGKYTKIIAIEPDVDSCLKMKEYVQNEHLERVSIYSNGCWNENAVLNLSMDKESSLISEEGTKIVVKRIDDQFKDEAISLIKINYMDGVLETLEGAASILKERKPKLAITVGFDEWAIMKVPRLIKRINPEYCLGLRYASPMPARLVLYAY